jgi:malonyl-CoA/methylmalonyl-CoA synthetase
MYARLLALRDSLPNEDQDWLAEGAQNMRLAVSGSAPLPPKLFSRWREMSGHCLLERFGMTEVGFVLSNPLHGSRVAGSVGTPIADASVRIVNERGSECPINDQGELRIKGPTLFSGYFDNPVATRDSFDVDGFFKSGDIAKRDEEGRFWIVGRASVDVIKRGGYKVSALDIERAVSEIAGVHEVAVVGVEDHTLGQKIVAVIAPVVTGAIFTSADLRSSLKGSLPPYSLPDDVVLVGALPRNAMGKVNKKELARSIRTAEELI